MGEHLQAEQVRLGREAREYYDSHVARNARRANEFDKAMLTLFDAIASGEGDIDERIEKLHEIWQSENFWQRFLDRAKLDVVWEAMAKRLAQREHETGVDTEPVRANWTRLLRVGNKHWGMQETMTKAWVDITPSQREL
jgi:hypothetical protein